MVMLMLMMDDDQMMSLSSHPPIYTYTDGVMQWEYLVQLFAMELKSTAGKGECINAMHPSSST